MSKTDKLECYYHGSSIRGLKTLVPACKTRNTIREPLVFLTKSYAHAVLYIWSRPFKWVMFQISGDGTVTFTEQFPGALREFYDGAGGCVYQCGGKHPDIYLSNMENVYLSQKPVPVAACQTIENAYAEILRLEEAGSLRIRRFETLTPEERWEIQKRTVRAIHFQKLLFEPTSAMARFVQEKFPLAWEIASKNTEQEIREIREEWWRSVGVR